MFLRREKENNAKGRYLTPMTLLTVIYETELELQLLVISDRVISLGLNRKIHGPPDTLP